MRGLPTRCLNPRCGHVFETVNLIGGPGAMTLRLENSFTRCPQCGSQAAMGDGTYSYDKGAMSLADGPPFTKQIIEKLSEIAERAKSKVIEAEELMAEVADVSPELAAKIRARGPLSAYVIILILLWLIKSVSLNITVDLNRLIDQAFSLSADDQTERIFNSPMPIELPAPNEPEHPMRVAQQGAPPSRQVRRRLERLSKKPKPRP